MPSLKCSIIFAFLLSLSSSLFTFTSADNPKFLGSNCSDKNFTRNSTYQSNINLLLSSLPSDANSSHKFSNATAGQDPDRVYGLFQCRGDVTTTTCQDCVALASTRATQLCPDHKGAIIWYDECLFRYSDSYIFSTPLHYPGIVPTNDTTVKTDLRQFVELVWRLTNEAAIEAANDPRKFATRKGITTASQPVYVLVQCTQDLSNTDCSGCLRESIANLQSGRLGASSFKPSCNSRYESYLFYNENLTTLLPPQGKSQISSSLIKAIVAPITVFAVLVVVGYCFLTRRARRKKYNTLPDKMAGNDITSIETLQFDFGTIEAATNRFSTDNKLGEGGFGEVYQGVLSNGQVVAIKRLSKSSGQGEEEFKSEVLLVAKLHHKNLVRLMGFCLEEKEKILVYEFVSNKSLDYFLFGMNRQKPGLIYSHEHLNFIFNFNYYFDSSTCTDPEKRGQLDWSQRYKIIEGIARGILYLHEDSRLRIIHRDLKASNILLDEDMNPKISDFGMAKIFGIDQTQGSTKRIKGTYGYMSPEYAMRGQFSVKSDVYSFGVLILEIITGKKNSNFNQSNGVGGLLNLAWKHWKEETPMLLLDPILTDSYSRNEVMRCIHMGLLCVQENPAARPTMATIDLVLNSHSVTLPVPKQPAFLLGKETEPNMQITSTSMPWSVDVASITEVHPR